VVRPLVLVFTAIAFTVTLIFDASVEAQGGAYATGVLVLMSSAAVTLSAHRRGSRRGAIAFGLIALVFFYTTIANIVERPDGIRIAAFFISAIVLTSMVSRVFRSTELRVTGVELDELTQSFMVEWH
jgi:hypothetical protein